MSLQTFTLHGASRPLMGCHYVEITWSSAESSKLTAFSASAQGSLQSKIIKMHVMKQAQQEVIATQIPYNAHKK